VKVDSIVSLPLKSSGKAIYKSFNIFNVEKEEDVMDAIIEAKIPEQLLNQAKAMVQEGWISDLNSLMSEAIRRYIESHQSQITESFIQEDVQWGLHGED